MSAAGNKQGETYTGFRCRREYAHEHRIYLQGLSTAFGQCLVTAQYDEHMPYSRDWHTSKPLCLDCYVELGGGR